ncbi:hypothetical protein GCM10009527_055540 [Actinomadura nitritigenes]
MAFEDVYFEPRVRTARRYGAAGSTCATVSSTTGARFPSAGPPGPDELERLRPGGTQRGLEMISGCRPVLPGDHSGPPCLSVAARRSPARSAPNP